VNASVRSGTNRLHSSAWEYLRNTDLNATGFFKPVGGQKPVYIQNQFGVAAGGPIKKDKIFLFADYEGLRRLQRALSYSSVPTLDQRNGIFNVPVLNPYTGALYGNGVIPQSEITAFGRKVFAELPAPNLPGNTNNYAALLPATDNDDKGDIRYDQYVNGTITVFSRYSQRVYTQLQPPNNGLPGPSGQGAGIFNIAKNKQSASGVTWTINPASLLEFRFGASKTEGTRSPATLDGGPSMLALYGIPGLPTTKDLTGGLNTQNVTGYVPYGRDFASPQAQNPIVLNPKINYSRVFGRHTFKIGYEFQAIDTLLEDFSPLYGQDIYNGQFSNPTPAKNNTLYNLADFLFGARSTYQLTNYTIAHLRQRMHFAYLQDDYKVSPRLTLNLGARYEFATPQYERDNHMTNYDPVTNSLVSAKNGSPADRGLVNPAYKNWAPRLGLAYSLNPKTVIRSGYAISYVLFIRQGPGSVLAYNGPYVVNAQITQSPSEPLCGPNSPPLTCFRPTQLGYPDGFASPANFSTVNTKTIYIPKDVRTPYVQNWHFTIQRELAKDLVLDLAYVGNHGVALWANADLNQALPNLPNQFLPLKPRRPDAQFDYIATNFSAGFSTYHALQVKLEKRYGQGLYLLNSFTWSKAIDNAAGAQEAGNYDHQTLNLFNFRSSKGLSAYDQPFNNTTSVVWDLPYGRNRRFGSGMPYVVDGLLGGWALTGINTMTSGQTINLLYDPSTAFIATAGDNDTAFYRPNITGDPMMPAGQRSIYQYLNPNTVQIPTDVTHPYGNAGRNIARSDSYCVLDLGIQKRFRLPGEGRSLEFRTEMFNTLNKTNFSYPNSDRSTPSFGRITSAYPARQVQFALRFAF
jgi:TonB dependent receptor